MLIFRTTLLSGIVDHLVIQLQMIIWLDQILKAY